MKAEIGVEILKKIVENIDEGIHFIDKSGITRLYNHKMAEIENISRESIIGKRFSPNIFKSLSEMDSTLLRVLKENVAIKDNIQKYLNKSGKEIITINSTIPIEINGEIIGALEIAKDMTSIKSLSDEVIKLQKINENFDKDTVFNENKQTNKKSYEFKDIIGESSQIKKAIYMAKKASENDAAVLIYGETGTGKELLSQSIHYNSGRKNGPFLAINCAALPETLFEAILFGTTKGSFTGAIDKAGLFEQANGGTLLLDEINSISPQMQAKLLRALQEKVIRRIGGTKDISVDVRVISTTNENPKDIIKSGKMRLDLYYRLNVIFLEIPPLRERTEDVLLLTNKFIENYNMKLDKNIKGISEDVKKIFTKYLWPGNIRELDNVIYSSMIMADENILNKNSLNMYWDDELLKKDEETQDTYINLVGLKEEIEGINSSLEDRVSKIEENYIRNAIEAYPNNLSKAAAFLGISRQALQYKMKKYNILKETLNFGC
ncbi:MULTISPECIES: sigma-54 interaction domain-containing protein [Fusobacterium]|uniref:sigma-54 interaction domain-containing protein n=1 Tax=Fusobacterium TaxID=848 RepID=UPI0025C487DE|nr:sigma 54-interacting transcriptional regulator [Fusobacterium sp.]MCI5725856.1 sigma 54-interacting transcriptional regulator [Fusobacterium sp.]MCI7224426.1 sigma 54-interacting transcriptional regulator [Fusobacterium sp.]